MNLLTLELSFHATFSTRHRPWPCRYGPHDGIPWHVDDLLFGILSSVASGTCLTLVFQREISRARDDVYIYIEYIFSDFYLNLSINKQYIRIYIFIYIYIYI